RLRSSYPACLGPRQSSRYFSRTLLPLRKDCARRACRGLGIVSACFRDNRAARKLGSDAQYPTGLPAGASIHTHCNECLREKMDSPPAAHLTLQQQDDFLRATTSSRHRGTTPV